MYLDGKKGAIFDLDGTLISSSHVWKDIDRRFLQKRGIEVPDDYAREISLMNFIQGAEYTIKRFGLDEKPQDLIDEWQEMSFKIYAHELRLYEGAREYLQTLKERGLRLALATASSPTLYRAVLENNEVLELFDVFTSTEEVVRGKTSPDVYLYAAGKLGCEVRHCMVFEDLCEGICSANRAGFFTAACLADVAQSSDRENLAAQADISFCNYGELNGGR